MKFCTTNAAAGLVCSLLFVAVFLLSPATCLLPTKQGTLFYLQQSLELEKPFEKHPHILNYQGSAPGDYFVVENRLNGPVNDAVTNACGVLYAVGDFDETYFNVTKTNLSKDFGFAFKLIHNPMPLFVLNSDIYYAVESTNSITSEYVSAVSSFDGAINSVSVECSGVKNSAADYCNSQCDIYIGGSFSLVNSKTKEKLVNAARYDFVSKQWYSVGKLPAFEQGESVTKIQRNKFGVWIATTSRLLLGAIDNSKRDTTDLTKLEYVELTKLNPGSQPTASVKDILLWTSGNIDSASSNQTVYITGDFQTASCSYVCAWSPVSKALFKPYTQEEAAIVEKSAIQTLIDFAGYSDTDVYISQQKSIIKLAVDGKWSQVVDDTGDAIISMGLCYENSVMCNSSEVKLFATTNAADMLLYQVAEPKYIQVSKLSDLRVAKRSLSKYTVYDDLVTNHIFNIPNSGKLFEGERVDIYSDRTLPTKSLFQCQFEETVTSANRTDDFSVACVTPYTLSGNPKNLLMMRVEQRVPSVINHNKSRISYKRNLMYYDGTDICAAVRYDVRFKMSPYMSISIIILMIVFVIAISLLLLVTIYLLLPCKCGVVSKTIEDKVSDLEVDAFEIERDTKQVKQKQKTVLGGWVTIAIVSFIIVGIASTIITSIDPFSTTSNTYEDQYTKSPAAFVMTYKLNKTSCDFSACEEYMRPSEKITVVNQTTEEDARRGKRNYMVYVATELYAPDKEYSIETDQCCSRFYLTPIPQTRAQDGGLFFKDAFPTLDDYKKSALLKYVDINYYFDTYSNPKNRTSDIRLYNRWNTLKLDQSDSFIGLITDAIFNIQKPLCLFSSCDIPKKKSGARSSYVVPENCYVYGSGDPSTKIRFYMQDPPFTTTYSGNPSVPGTIAKVVTIIGSLLGLRPAFTGLMLGFAYTVNHKFPYLKSALIFLITIPLYLPLVVAAVFFYDSYATVQYVLYYFGIDAYTLLNSTAYIVTIFCLAVFIKILVSFVLTGILGWNADFYSTLRKMTCSREFCKRAWTEPFIKLKIGWKSSAAFKVVVALCALIFLIPLLEYLLFFIVIIVWKCSGADKKYRAALRHAGESSEDDSEVERRLINDGEGGEPSSTTSMTSRTSVVDESPLSEPLLKMQEAETVVKLT